MAALAGDRDLTLEEAMAKGMTESMFKEVDADDSGTISQTELKLYMDANGMSVINEAADEGDYESEEEDVDPSTLGDLDAGLQAKLDANRKKRDQEEAGADSVLRAGLRWWPHRAACCCPARGNGGGTRSARVVLG